MISRKRLSLLLALTGLVGTAALIGPPVYACHGHPLARLHATLEVGDSWSAVDSAFTQYAKVHTGPSIDLVRGERTSPERFNAPVEAIPADAASFLFLYDVFYLDDLQLTAWFDADRRLVGTYYLCD